MADLQATPSSSCRLTDDQFEPKELSPCQRYAWTTSFCNPFSECKVCECSNARIRIRRFRMWTPISVNKVSEGQVGRGFCFCAKIDDIFQANREFSSLIMGIFKSWRRLKISVEARIPVCPNTRKGVLFHTGVWRRWKDVECLRTWRTKAWTVWPRRTVSTKTG